MTTTSSGPHQIGQLRRSGTPLDEAHAAAVLVHGRGATARSILGLAEELGTEGVAYLAPQATQRSWYPKSFLAPVEFNEPGRSSGLRVLAEALEQASEAGIPDVRQILIGFSQGACLATEFAARNPRCYGGIAGLSGGLIGDDIDPDEFEGDLEGTPVFLGCSDVDPHIPEERVHQTADIFEALGGEVTTRIYEGMGHGVNEDELEFVAEMIDDLLP